MATSTNNFFNSSGQQFGNLFGNPAPGQSPVTTSGNQRGYFTNPPDLLSGVYDSGNAPFRTFGGSNPIQLQEVSKVRTRLQQGGFLPLNYTFRDGEYYLSIPSNPRTPNDVLSENINSYNSFGDIPQSDFKFSLQDFVKYNSSKNVLETSDGSPNSNPWSQEIDQSPFRLSQYPGTPDDNEDPVYFGFEITINVDSSPLLNGELEKFLTQMSGYSGYTEFKSRLEILNQFKNELSRYFNFSRSLSSSEFDPSKLIVSTSVKEKKYYIRKLSGLDKLQENNTPSAKKFLTDYGKDILTITFYEDTTLNLGTLVSLYKLLYWSKRKGKSLIPENLLRFDCEIIISELRNFARLKRSGNMLQELSSNLSRYRYNVYECQFFANKMTHPDSIDLWPGTLERTETFDMEMSYKFSSMVFERFDPSSLIQKTLNNVAGQNVSNDPLAVIPLSPNTQLNNPIIGGSSSLSTGYSQVSNVVLNTYDALNSFGISGNSNVVTTSTQSDIGALQQNQNISIYNSSVSPNPKTNLPVGKGNIYGASAKALLENIKSDALRAAQRQLNAQFTLLNNSLNKARNSFGMGQMSSPTPGGNFFFDVQNSLRGFAGDVLTNVISGR